MGYRNYFGKGARVSKYSCSNSDCTVAVTDKCLLSHVPIESCPNVEKAVPTGETAPDKSATVATTTVYAGNELGVQQAAELMATRYGTLVGVLGAFGTGKTCLLSSLYLLASCGDLRPSFQFAGSATLPGFESRLRLLRKWVGNRLPEQIVDHTFLADPRQPGLLHLALIKTTPVRSVYDLLFTDLPGEWTTDLIKRAEAAKRLLFLRRADALVITFPGPLLVAPGSRNSQILSARVLLQRLRDSIGLDLDIPVVLAITRSDETGPTVPPAIYEIVETARQFGFLNVSHVPIAAFSDRPDIPSGLGVASLLEMLLQNGGKFINSTLPIASDGRMFARYQTAAKIQT
jgi:hypothetical protein